MARGTVTLESMVSDLRLETGRSSDVNLGQDEYPSLVRLLQRVQTTLYWDFDWPFLKIRRDLTLAAGQRYYDFPSDMFFERSVTTRSNGYGLWLPLVRGITEQDYDIFNSDNNVRSSPAQKWDIIDAGSGDQVEIWPIPVTDGEKVRYDGFKKPADFISDESVCTLDDTLIVMFAAAEILARDKSADAQAKLATANKLYLRMRGGAQRNGQDWFVPGSNEAPQTRPGKVRVIAVHDGT